jgi:hypothetical protein
MVLAHFGPAQKLRKKTEAPSANADRSRRDVFRRGQVTVAICNITSGIETDLPGRFAE